MTEPYPSEGNKTRTNTSNSRLPPMGLVGLTPEQRKDTFVCNLRQLLDLIGGSRKIAAYQMDVSYRWLRRMVSAGVSRPDERSRTSLQKLAAYFALPNIDALWKPNLVASLIDSEDGKPFVERFGANVARLVNEQMTQSGTTDQSLVNIWRSVHSEQGQEQAMRYEDKLDALVATERHDALKELDAELKQLDAICKRLVEEAYEQEFGSREAGIA